MSDQTSGFLAERGVRLTPDELTQELELAVRQRMTRLALSPREELPADQAAILEEGGLDLSPARAGERPQSDLTSADYAALMKTSLTTRSLAELLGRNPSRIRQRIQSGALYAFQPGTEWLIPRFQIHDGALIPGIEKVVPELRAGLHPLKVERWFLTPDPDLCDADDTRTWAPREWLLSGGDPARVAELAQHL